MAHKNTIKDILADEIKDLYSAEKQLTKALPDMIDGAKDRTLKEALENHLAETENHVTRLEEIGNILDIKVTGKKCVGMEGCIKEGAEVLDEKGEDHILDLGLIGAGSRVEHYEMAGYMTAISLAKKIAATEVANLLSETLKEEQAAADKLREIATSLLNSVPHEALQPA